MQRQRSADTGSSLRHGFGRCTPSESQLTSNCTGSLVGRPAVAGTASMTSRTDGEYRFSIQNWLTASYTRRSAGDISPAAWSVAGAFCNSRMIHDMDAPQQYTVRVQFVAGVRDAAPPPAITSSSVMSAPVTELIPRDPSGYQPRSHAEHDTGLLRSCACPAKWPSLNSRVIAR